MAIADTIPVNTTVQSILARYESLLAEADMLFQDYVRTHSLKLTCGPACPDCCHHYVTIHFIEACYLQMGMEALEPRTRRAVRLKAMRNIPTLERLERFARTIEERSGGAIQDAKLLLGDFFGRKIKCPFVDGQGRCLVYGYRPPIARLFGVPLKIREKLMWCEKNTLNPLEPPFLDARKLQERVVELSRILELFLTGNVHPRRFIWFYVLFPLNKFSEGSRAMGKKELNPEEQRLKACSERSESIRRRLLKLGGYSTPAIATILAVKEGLRHD